MIHTNRIVTVGEQESIIDRPIVLYRGDREVEIEFTLVGNEFTFSEEGNVIKSVNASHGQLVLNTPSGENMFSELAECHEGKVVFVVTKEMIDEFIEMGFYSFQIRLYDSAEMKSRVTIPPVMNGFDIRNPIAAEDEANTVDQGIVGYARIFKDQSNEELPTFDWQDNYVKTEWVHHDVITENKLNKIEDALYSINANVKESDVVMLNALDNVKKDADKYVKEHMAEVEQDVEEFERNINSGVEKFKVDTNAAITAHKNEVSEELDGLSSQLEHITNYPKLDTENFDIDIKYPYGHLKRYGHNGVDDTIAFQRAVDSGFTVILPIGETVIYETIKSKFGFSMKGENPKNGLSCEQGSATSMIVQKFEGIGINVFYADNNQIFSGGVFEGFGIKLDDNVKSSNSVGLRFKHHNHLTLTNIQISNYINGKGLSLEGNAQYGLIQDCKFSKNKYNIYSERYNGIHVRDCMFDGNRNGSDNNANPYEGTYGILINVNNADSWFIVNCRFQGIETCIKSNSVSTTVDSCRFEMFKTGIHFTNKSCFIIGGNTFNGHLGSTLKQCIINEGDECVIEPFSFGAVTHFPVINKGNNVQRKDLQSYYVYVGDISNESKIISVEVPYYGMVSNLKLIHQSNGIVNQSYSNRWHIHADTRNGYVSTNSTEFLPNTIIPIFGEASSSSGTVKTGIININLTKYGTEPNLIKDVVLIFDIDRY